MTCPSSRSRRRGTRQPRMRRMQTTTRRVAVIGGNRIPFARSNAAYATASNQDMLTAAIDGLVARFGLEGERLGEVVAGAVLKHSPRLQPRPARRCSAPSSRPRRPPPTSSRPAAPACRPRSRSPTRSRSARSTSGIAGGTDTTSDAPVAISDKLRKKLMKVNAAKDTAGRLKALGRDPARRHRPRDPAATASRAPGCRWASTPRSPRWSGRSPARTRTSSPHARTSNLAAAYDARLPRRPGHAVPRPRARQQPAPRLLAREARHAQAGLRQGRGGHDDRRQLHAADRRRLRRAARVARSGPRSAACPCWPTSSTRETAAVDYVHGGEGLLMAPAYAVPRMLQRAAA